MDVFTLRAVLGLDSTEYDKGLDKKKSEASGIGTAIGNGLQTAAKVGVAAVTAASGAAVAFGATAVNAGKEFDSSMSQVAATMGKSMDEMQNEVGTVDLAWGTFSGNLRDYAQEMGANTAFSAKEAADALNYMALAGYDTQTSMEMLPNVLSLAAAGGLDLASASDMVTDAQSALGLSLDETGQMVDQMAMASSKSNTSVGQLGEAFLTIGATARNVAGGTTELSTVLGVLADNGIKGAEGGTHLRNAILSLQTPTKDGREALAQLGMTYDDMYDSAGNMRALPEIFQELGDKMEGMNQQSKDAIISGLFNKTDLAAVNALIGTSGERWDELTGYIDNAAGSAQKMADTQLDNLEGDITLFKSALEGVQIAISDMVTPALRNFVQMGSDGLTQLASALKAGDVNAAIEAFTGLVTNATQAVVEHLPEVIDLGIKLIEAVIQGIIQAMPKLVSSAVNLFNAFKTSIINKMNELVPGSGNIMQNVFTTFETWFGMIQNIVSTITELIKEIWNRFGDNILKAAEIIWKRISTVIETAIRLVQSVLNFVLAAIKGDWQGMWNAIKDAALTIWNFISTMIQTKIEWVKNIIDSVLKVIKGLWDTAWTALKDKVSEIWNNIKQTIDDLKKGISDNINNVKETITKGIGEAVDYIKKLPSQALSWGRDLIDNFVDGIRDKIHAVTDVISDVADAVTDFIGFSEPDKGPLSNFHTYAPDMIDLFTKGIRDNAYKIPEAFNTAMDMSDFSVMGMDARDRQERSGAVNVTQNIYSKAQTASELMREARWEQERAVLMGV